jgi:putative addiction module CopG family antidote
MIAHEVRLTTEMNAFVEQQIESGHFEDISAVLQAGLRLLKRETQEYEQKIPTLRRLAKEATDQLDRGEGIVLQTTEEIHNYFAALDSDDEE